MIVGNLLKVDVALLDSECGIRTDSGLLLSLVAEVMKSSVALGEWFGLGSQ